MNGRTGERERGKVKELGGVWEHCRSLHSADAVLVLKQWAAFVCNLNYGYILVCYLLGRVIMM
jgi:hypothetical protein